MTGFQNVDVGGRQVAGADQSWKDAEQIIEVIREEVVFRSQSNYHAFFRRYWPCKVSSVGLTDPEEKI